MFTPNTERNRKQDLALISKQEFISDIRAALAHRVGYAAAKIGYSQVYRLSATMMASRLKDPTELLRGIEDKLAFEGLKQQGIFPADLAFYEEFDRFYVTHLKNIDCLGVFPELMAPTKGIIEFFQISSKAINYHDQEPDRSAPGNEQDCYLPCFSGKKILLICSFAEILKERSTKEIFEGVWAKTGKKWFYPKSVEALEFPYGFAEETQKKYATSIDLFEEIRTAVEKEDFDVALIGAGGLAVPIASFIKSTGKVGIDLGGHLQIVFGVLGKRWRNWGDWREKYFNDWWINMPARYRPKETDVCDSGAYW